MTASRLRYALVLSGGGVFFLFYKLWLSWFVLLLLLLFPLLSLILSLLTIRRCDFSLAAQPPTVPKGTPIRFSATMYNRSLLPVSWVGCHLWIENALGQAETPRRCTLALPPHASRSIDLTVSSPYAGRLLCCGDKFRCRDFLGLFSFSLGPGQRSTAYVLPTVLPVSPTLRSATHLQPDGDEAYPGGPGDDPTETFDLRSYRPGDPLRAIHWKLSSRTDALMVRQFSTTAASSVALVADLQGTLEGRDLLLDSLASIHQFLLDSGVTHRVIWYDPAQGILCRRDVMDEEGWALVLRALLSPPGPAGTALSLLTGEGRRAAESPRLLYFGGRLGSEEIRRIAALPNALALIPADGNPDLPPGVTVLKRSTLSDTLSALVI